jgi:crotonobetainyl-CoA hydratase
VSVLLTEDAKSAVLVEQRGHVLILTINRPEARNAVNESVHIGLGLGLERAECDVAVRAVILTGAADQAFCAGADLKALARGERIIPRDKIQAAWGFAGVVAHPISKPLVAAVNGIALGGGTELALACDLVVAAETAMFGLPEVKRGILAAAGGAFRLVQQLPRKLAMEFMLTGESFTTARARELGLVNRITPQGQVMEVAMELAQQIAMNAPLAVQASKRIANGIVNGRIDADREPWALNAVEAAMVMRSEDGREGPRAFAEKRAPVWQGR